MFDYQRSCRFQNYHSAVLGIAGRSEKIGNSGHINGAFYCYGRGSHRAKAKIGPDYKYCLNNCAYRALKLSPLYSDEVIDYWDNEVNGSRTRRLEYYGASFYAGFMLWLCLDDPEFTAEKTFAANGGIAFPLFLNVLDFFGEQ